ncbi:MAG TPA: helix-turn-helix domain-containing protein [Albitalea sp.]
MPATAPPIGKAPAAALAALGERIRDQRKRLGVNATAAAEAAGMSRVTLHRIERGEPSVTMGAYLSAMAALGLELELSDPAQRRQRATAAHMLPQRITLADYPQLQRLAWQLHGVTELSPREALDLYERNWRHVDQRALSAHERLLVKMLAAELGGGRLLV